MGCPECCSSCTGTATSCHPALSLCLHRRAPVPPLVLQCTTRLSLNHTQRVPECHGHLGDGVLETPAELEPGRAHSALPALPAAVLGGCVGTLAKHQ